MGTHRLVIALTLAAALAAAPAAHGQTILSVIQTGLAPIDNVVAVNPFTGVVYYAAEDRRTPDDMPRVLAAVSADGAVVRTVETDLFVPYFGPLGETVSMVALNPFTDHVFVVGRKIRSNDLLLDDVDGRTLQLRERVTGVRPYGIAVNPFFNRIYVAETRGLATIDPTTGAIRERSLAVQPVAVALDPIGGRVFLPGFASPSSDRVVTVVGPGDRVHDVPIPGDLHPRAAAYSALTGRLYVACSRALVVMNTRTEQMTDYPLDFVATAVAVNPVTERVHLLGDFVLQTFDGRRRQLEPEVPLPDVPGGVGVDPLRGRVYITSFGALTIAVDAPRVRATR